MTSSIRTRVAILASLVALAAIGIGARLLDLQIRRTDELRAEAERQHRQVIEVGGQRGAILDRELRELAVSVTSYSLYVHPGRVKDRDRAARLLSRVLAIPESRILAKLRSDALFEWIQRRLDPATHRAVLALAEQGLEVGPASAFGFEEEPKRFYPQGTLATQVVGFANIDQRGVEGIEKRLDDVLQGGAAQYLALRDARGGGFLQLLRPAEKRAEDVVLTIDLVLQHLVERELDRALAETGAHAATAVLLDPATGEVLAMANRPAPDPANYGSSPAAARRNRAITDQYEPGSTFKVVTAAAALEEGTVSPEQRFDCSPITIHGKTYRDTHDHGVLSVREILEKSSNNGAIRIARTMSYERFHKHIVDFGFGRKTGIEFPGEISGSVTEVPRASGQTVPSVAMGYEVGITALQMASAIATVANEGVRVPPRLVRGFRHADGTFEPAEASEPVRVVSARTAVTLGTMLEGVVVRGTGKAAAVPGYHVAGKTGTSHKFVQGRGYTNEYFASFAAYAPLHDPRIAGILVLDTPRGGFYYGGLTAAPALGRVFADALSYLGVPPDDDPWKTREDALADARDAREARERKRKPAKPRPKDPDPEPEVAVTIGPGDVPDLSGKSLRGAIAALGARGCLTHAEGSGVVVSQSPAPGTPIRAGMVCGVSLGALPETEGRP